MAVAVIVIANDFSAINVALPTMEQDFDTDVNTIQWVVNAYALTFGVLIVTGGRLADLFGRRNAFFLGTVIFASMSASSSAFSSIRSASLSSAVARSPGGVAAQRQRRQHQPPAQPAAQPRWWDFPVPRVHP